MKKNRSTKYKVNNVVFDVIIILLLILLAICMLSLFWKDLNRSLSRNDMEPIAYVTFKHNSAQRKFNDRMIWDRLRQKSDIYNGDTIRTADKSEATLHFPNSNSLDIDANTLIQIFVNENGETEITISSGKLSVDTSPRTKPVSIVSGTTKIVVGKDSSVRTVVEEPANSSAAFGSPSGARMQVEVTDGTASVATPEGKPKSLSVGDAVAVDETGKQYSFEGITVLSPAPAQEILSFTGEPQDILFSWNKHGTKLQSIVIDISENPTFAPLYSTQTVSDTTQFTQSLPVGSYWWRVSIADSDESEAGKLKIIDASPCTLLSPANKAQFTYRTLLPEVRLSWNENSNADSYEVEVSTQPDMYSPFIAKEVVQTSFMISDAKEGQYYWRVTPRFRNDRSLEAQSSPVRSFSVLQKDSLSAPELLLPSPNSFVDYSGKSKVAFSWKEDTDADSYTIIVSRNKDLSNPIISEKTAISGYTVADNSLLKKGRYYWTARLTDREGNNSPDAKPFSFIATDTEISQRIIAPADGYIVEANQSTDLVYRWKNTVPFATKVQIATSTSFNTLVYSEDATSSGKLSNIKLRAGTYYWRIYSADETGFVIHSAPNKLIVVPPLTTPVIRYPVSDNQYMLKKDVPFECKWKSVDGAEYYKVSLTLEGRSEPLFAKDSLQDTSFSMETNVLPKGTYTVTVQPFANRSDGSSSRSGNASSCSFILTRPNPLVLETPQDNATFTGLDALFAPSSVIWSSKSTPSESYFILARSKAALPSTFDNARTAARLYSGKLNDNAGISSYSDTIIMCVKNPRSEFNFVRLAPGTYYWTICAVDHDGTDISSETIRSFTVSPLPFLQAPALTSPEANKLFDVEAIMKSRTITFAWGTVADATSYTCSVYEANPTGKQNKLLVTKRFTGSDNLSFTLDMADLNEGTFVWTVEAERQLPGGMLIQKGDRATGTFTIDLPDMDAPEIAPVEGVLYGE